MSYRMTVYSPDGEMWENITPTKAKKLVVEKGWTFDPPDEVKPLFKEEIEPEAAEDETEDSYFDDLDDE